MRVLAAGYAIAGYEIAFCPEFDVGHYRVPTVAGGVFHAWYVTRLIRNEAEVIRETEGRVSRERYLTPLTARLVAAYGP